MTTCNVARHIAGLRVEGHRNRPDPRYRRTARLLAVVLFAVWNAASAAEPATAREPAALFGEHCAHCHVSPSFAPSDEVTQLRAVRPAEIFKVRAAVLSRLQELGIRIDY